MISLWALERQLDVTGLALLTARSAARLCEQALVRQALRRSSARLVCPAEDSREQADVGTVEMVEEQTEIRRRQGEAGVTGGRG